MCDANSKYYEKSAREEKLDRCFFECSELLVATCEAMEGSFMWSCDTVRKIYSDSLQGLSGHGPSLTVFQFLSFSG